MKSPAKKVLFGILIKLSLCLLFFIGSACNKDTIKEEVEIAEDASEKESDDGNTDTNAEENTSGDGENNEGETEEQPCSNNENPVFSEKNGLIHIEFEDTEFTGDWKLKKDGTSFSGQGYMVWEGSQNLGTPGNGTAVFKLKIENPGTYQFLWKSAVKIGDNGTEHNDSWLRFSDAEDFYAQNGESIVYPKGTGKTPNPEGATKEGWFKIYRSGNDLDFKWQARTFDNNAHDIFVVFENAATYTMEVSARSSGHGIDKFVLFKDMAKETATSEMNGFSRITCD